MVGVHHGFRGGLGICSYCSMTVVIAVWMFCICCAAFCVASTVLLISRFIAGSISSLCF